MKTIAGSEASWVELAKDTMTGEFPPCSKSSKVGKCEMDNHGEQSLLLMKSLTLPK